MNEIQNENNRRQKTHFCRHQTVPDSGFGRFFGRRYPLRHRLPLFFAGTDGKGDCRR